MNMSDCSTSSDNSELLKCLTPPTSKTKYIDENVKIESNDESSESDSSDQDEYRDVSSSSSSRSPSPKRSVVEFNRFEHYDRSDDEDNEYRTEIFHSQEITLKISYCYWNIDNFNSCKLNNDGYINSKIYSAGAINDLQWYFRIERFKQKNEVFYGVYVCILTYNESEAKMDFRAYIMVNGCDSRKLSQSKNFPQNEGFKFLGYLRKSYMRNMISGDELLLSFIAHIQYKKIKNKLCDDLKILWKNKKFTDFTFLVDGESFPVHKTILAARSSVFAEMFEKDRYITNLIIDDIEPEAMEELLRFIYTGKIKKLIKYLKQFSLAAHKYNLTELKSICEKAMLCYS